MKMKKLALAAGLAVLMVMTGCGQDPAEETAPTQETEQTEETSEAGQSEDSAQTEETSEAEQSTDSTQTEDTSETEQTEDADASGGQAEADTQESAGEAQTYEDNFAVDEEAVVAFGDKVKEAVAAKDMEALADLTAFPVYVGIPDTEGVVETRDDFLALGADQVLTDELVASVEAADVSGQEPSMAGFVLSGESGRPNIIFGVVDGVLAVTGINY